METFILLTVKNSNLKGLEGRKFTVKFRKAKVNEYSMLAAIKYQEAGYKLDQIRIITIIFNDDILKMHGIVENGRFVHINNDGTIAYFDFI